MTTHATLAFIGNCEVSISIQSRVICVMIFSGFPNIDCVIVHVMRLTELKSVEVMLAWHLYITRKGVQWIHLWGTVYPRKYAHGFVMLCFVVVMQSFIMNSHEVFIHIHQGCFAGTGAIVRLPQCQWSKPGGYGKISQCITTTKHSKAKTVCIFLGIYCKSTHLALLYW